MQYPAPTYLDLSHAPDPARDLFVGNTPVWDALKKIGLALEALDWTSLPAPSDHPGVSPRAHLGDAPVYLGPGTVVEPGAFIKGPAWIGPNCQVRSGAYVRENVIAGEGVVLGNSCEFKNCIVFDQCEVPHFNYVGDSILGFKAHLGAGVILSNVRLDRNNIAVSPPPEDPSGNTPSGDPVPDTIDTGLRKFGAIVGDRTEIGCNSVLSPGSIIGRDSIIYPGTQWKGVLPARHIVQLRQTQRIIERR